MNPYNIAKLLKNTYEPYNIDKSAFRKRADYLSECIIPKDIFVYSGKGATLQTNRGELVDMASMTVNCILGQNDPWVNANLIAYILSNRPSFLTTKLGSDFYFKVARRIISVTKIKNSVINHRQCNGTDVTELAVMTAYNHRVQGKTLLISFQKSYHGQGLTAYLMSQLQRKHQFLVRESPVVFLNEPSSVTDINQDLTKNDEEILQQLRHFSKRGFAVIIEPIQVNNSVNTPSKKFLHELKEICTKESMPLIFDEVQTCFGWLGTMTAAERYGVLPNMLAMSKAITSGNGPLSILVSDRKFQDIKEGTGAKTNGADVRSLVACNAIMDRLMGMNKHTIPSQIPDQLGKELEVGLLSLFPSRSKNFLERLQDTQARSNGLVSKIKGDGFIRGLEIRNKKGACDKVLTANIQNELLLRGLLVRAYASTLIIKPPLVITNDELDRGFSVLNRVIKKYYQTADATT